MISSWSKFQIPLTHSIDGQPIELTKFTLDSGIQGPHLYLQSGVHGAELQGHIVIQELIRHAPALLSKGKITCIPCANPIGMNHKIGESTAGRFHPVSRENWNRNYLEIPSLEIVDMWDWDTVLEMIKQPDGMNSFRNYCIRILHDKLENQKHKYQLSMPQKLAWILQLEAFQADLVLDLHTGPKSARYIYSADFCVKKSIDLGFDYTLVIPAKFDGAMDEACFMPWVHLRDKLQELGQQIEIPIESYTLELGDEETVSTATAMNDLVGIFHFMMRRNMIDQQVLGQWINDVPFISLDADRFEASMASSLDQFISYRAPQSGLVEYLVQPGEHVDAGEPLFQIHRPSQCLESEICIVETMQSGVIINICTSSAVTEGMRLIDILQDPYSVTAI